ncbi:hypothetical protein Tco_0418401 [Tanacetum coccineum]
MEVGVMAAATVPFVNSSVTLTSERKGGGHTDSITGPNLRIQHPTKRFVISLDSLNHSSSNAADAEVSSVIRSTFLDPPIMTTVVATTVVTDTSSIPVPRAGHEPVHHTFFKDFVSTGEANPNIAGPSNPIGTKLSVDSFYVSQEMDSETLHQIYVSKWTVINKSVFDDPDMCCSLTDQLAPSIFFSQLRSMDYDQLFAEFNVGAAR